MSKMVKCKTCGADISSSSKSCPSCGEKHPVPFTKRRGLMITIAIIAALYLIISLSDSSTTTNKKDGNETKSSYSSTEKEPEETIYSIGDTVGSDKFEVTITNVKTQNSVGTQYLQTQAADGGIYVCVDYEIKNISEKPVSSFSCPTIKLINSNDVTFTQDVNATSYYSTQTDPNRKVLSNLNPGIKVNGSAVFEISKEEYDKGGFFVYIDADKNNKVKVN